MKTKLRGISLLALALSATPLVGCGAGDGAADPTPGDEQDVKAKAPKWDCALADDSAALEDLFIRTYKGKVKAYIDVSGPGDFFETYSYKVKASVDSKGDTLLKGTNFQLSISPEADEETLEHAASLTAVGPESSELNPGTEIDAKLACVKQ